MYRKLVKKLLKKHFGPQKSSLTVGDRSKREDTVQYYVSPELEDQFLAVRDFLDQKYPKESKVRLPELKQDFPYSLTDDGIPQCAVYKVSGGRWSARFCTVKEVRYRNIGGHISADFELKEDYARVSDVEYSDFYGFWGEFPLIKDGIRCERNGVPYEINRALKASSRFRNFTVDFLLAISEKENRPILRHVASTISECGCFLPPVTYSELLNCRTPSELLGRFVKDGNSLDVDLDRTDINTGYVMLALLEEIDPCDRDAIAGLEAPAVSKSIDLDILYSGFSARMFVRNYYTNVLMPHYPRIRMYADDYAKVCIDRGEKLRLSADLRNLILAHEELINRYRTDDTVMQETPELSPGTAQGS